ncbi:MAG: ABC transporter ATP-binding protein [Thermoplasmata archaeon]
MPLSVREVRKHFGGVKAVDGCDMEIEDQSIMGLIGPNGAGKSTLFNVIAGLLRPDYGMIRFNGHRIDGLPAYRVVKYGIVKTFQIPRGFENITVLENMMLAYQGHLGETLWRVFFQPKKVASKEREVEEKAMVILEMLEIDSLANDFAKNLSGGQKKLLELGRALMTDPDLVLLDEPVAGINKVLAEKLLRRLDELRQDGMTFFLIEHDMDVVMNRCDRIIVMHNGRKLAEGTPSEVKSNKVVIDSYLGG